MSDAATENLKAEPFDCIHRKIVVAREIAVANLALRASVVIDAVNPVPEARANWRGLTPISRCIFLETELHDVKEHRRRVEARQPDLDGQIVPTWEDVLSLNYTQWDEARDGQRYKVDTTERGAAVATALELIACHRTRYDDKTR